jgi:hypothetical protein
MVSNAIRPQSKHTPERDEHSEEIGKEEHALRLELEVLLDIPESKCRSN